MLRLTLLTGKVARLASWCAVALATACLGLSGCKECDPGSDTAKRDPTFDMPGQLRSRDKDGEFSGLSNKSQEIERHLGIR